MKPSELYKQWSTGINFDLDTKAELLAIKNDQDEIMDRFYKELDFGTAGIRGIIGAGTNRMNIYVVKRVSYAIAKLTVSQGKTKKGIIIGYDSRNFSYEFAKEAASVFAGYGIKVYMHSEICPVPVLSYTLRLLKCAFGVMITASHNPKEYNGYKVYGSDGAQLSPEDSNQIIEIMNNVGDYSKLPKFNFDFFINSGKITILGINVKNSYLKAIKKMVIDRNSLNLNAPKFKLIYTPLHGAGMNYVPKILKLLGFKELYTVKSQMIPDGNFSTVKVPNPEDGSVYDQAINLAEEKGAELILATDPDSDRCGAAIKNSLGEYELLNGNQIGILLLDHLITGLKSKNALPEKSFVVSTIVSTRMTEEICRLNDIEYIDVLTGFKYIGGEIMKNEELGDKKFLFGFEESYGYLPGSYARDKDAVATCMLLAETASYYASKDLNLLQALDIIYKKYGYYYETQVSLFFKGESGILKASEIMTELRKQKANITDLPIKFYTDYINSVKYDCTTNTETIVHLPKSDVLYYELEDSWFCIRPSGTEPKIKVYFGAKSSSMDKAKELIGKIKETVMTDIKKLYE